MNLTDITDIINYPTTKMKSNEFAITNILFSFFIWIGTWIAILITGIILCGLTLLLPFAQLFFFMVGWTSEGISPSPKLENFQAIEQATIDEFLKEYPHISCEVLTELLTVEDKKGGTVDVNHYTLVFRAKEAKENDALTRPKVLFIHGVHSHPMGWKEAIPNMISSGKDVYCTALPGFSLIRAPDVLWTMKQDELLHFYSEFVKQVIQRLFKAGEKPIIVSHSFGGIVSSHFCCSYPDLFDELVLLNPVGLLPTLHELTPFWAIFFNYCPFYLFRFFGRVLNSYTFPIVCNVFSKNKFFEMSELALITCKENYGGNLTSQFICVNPLKACWVGPYFFNKMLKIAHRVSAICSVGDTISPPHTLKLFYDISARKQTALYIIPGNAHNPSRECKDDFNCALNHILERIQQKEDPICESRHISDTEFNQIVDPHIWSVFDRKLTRRNIQNLYSSLLDTVKRSSSETIGGTTYYLVHQKEIVETTDEARFGLSHT